MKSERMYRVILGIVSFPVVTIFYSSEVINWVPGTMALPPMPVAFFLIWLVFVVTDLLYQFYMMYKIPVLTHIESGVEVV
ncbi:MAG: hypothetical protein E3J86_15080 [Candidatus Thorarchaeota archaeon]|nr:MAG: hypothetical protein E3J86_15080 [Candidatus Thorarchaeota archaeon]